MNDRLKDRLETGLDQALSRPKTKATEEEVAKVNRFVFAANIVGPIKALFDRQPSATGIQVIDPAERDEVTRTMDIALERLVTENATSTYRRKERQANKWARQSARTKNRGTGNG